MQHPYTWSALLCWKARLSHGFGHWDSAGSSAGARAPHSSPAAPVMCWLSSDYTSRPKFPDYLVRGMVVRSGPGRHYHIGHNPGLGLVLTQCDCVSPTPLVPMQECQVAPPHWCCCSQTDTACSTSLGVPALLHLCANQTWLVQIVPKWAEGWVGVGVSGLHSPLASGPAI